MVVPTGTATPWSELPIYPLELEDGRVAFFRDGHASGSADLLAEALRVEGVVRTLGRAIPVAESAQLDACWYGYVDESDDAELCDETGETVNGDVVDQVFECVVALVDVTEK